MHYIFVINGREDKRWIADEVDRQIRQAGSGLDYEIYTTSGVGDATRFTRIYCDLDQVELPGRARKDPLQGRSAGRCGYGREDQPLLSRRQSFYR